jgi:multiple antibiotic resistance protein
MDTDALIKFTSAMLAILNPVGSVALFTGMVKRYPPAARRAIAIKTGIAVAVILAVTVWAGEFILGTFGVGVPSLQVAGGVMIAMISLSMLQSSQSAIHDSVNDSDAPDPAQDIAVVPLAMPMIAGPGAMVTVIVNTHLHKGLAANLEMTLVCAVLAALLTMAFLLAGPITRALGAKGMDIVTKLMGMILLAIAAGMLTAGAKGLLPGLAG